MAVSPRGRVDSFAAYLEALFDIFMNKHRVSGQRFVDYFNEVSTKDL